MHPETTEMNELQSFGDDTTLAAAKTKSQGGLSEPQLPVD
jgi:hypothetical protein